MRRGGWLVVGVLWGGCFGASDDNPSLRCADAGACPSPLVCYEGFCVRAEGADASASGAVAAGDAGSGSSAAGPRTLDAGQRDAGGARDGGTPPSTPASPPQAPPPQAPQVPPQAPPPQAPPPQVPPQAPPVVPPAEPPEPRPPMDAGTPPGRPAEDDDRDDDADSDEGPRDARDGEDDCGRCRGSEVCREGVCCHERHIVCDGTCVDPRTDGEHCGACNIRCASECRDGSCVDDQGRVCIRGACFP